MFSTTTPSLYTLLYEKLSLKRIIPYFSKSNLLGQKRIIRLSAVKNRIRGFCSFLNSAEVEDRTKFIIPKNFIPHFCFLARPGTYSEVSFQSDDTSEAHCAYNILPDSPLEFCYCPPEAGIIGVNFCFGTHKKVNACSIQVAVYNEDMTLLASCTSSTKEFLDNQYSFLRFDSIIIAVNRPIIIRISSNDAQPDNCVAIWGKLSKTIESTTEPVYVLAKESKRTSSHLVTPFIDAPRTESFFPRYTASCLETKLAENVIGWQGLCFETKYQAIYQSSQAKISFLCPHKRLAKVVMTLVTFGRINHCTVVFELFRLTENQRQLCFTKTVMANSIVDCAAYELAFNPLGDSQFAWFEVVISSPDGSHQNCIGISGTAVIEELTIARNLVRLDSTPSMIDLNKTINNLTELYSSSIPEWTRILTIPLPEKFTVAVVYDLSSLRVDLTGLDNDRRVRLVSISEAEDCLSFLSELSMIVIAGETPFTGILETILEASRRLCIPSFSWGYPTVNGNNYKQLTPIASINQQQEASKADTIEGIRQRCDYDIESIATHNLRPLQEQRLYSHDLYQYFEEIFVNYRKTRLPKISVISILYRKEIEIEAVLESIRQQDYPGEIEIILVDDCSPDASSRRTIEISNRFPEAFSSQGRMPITIIKNEQNLGNCGSRNKAISAASGDIVLVIDADCVLNKKCLSTHASGHSIADVDVVIGTHNLESNHQEPCELLMKLESDITKTVSQAQLQDPTVLPSFLNSITRNISIRTDLARVELFDELFSYSTSPDSGFGWEDVEMGYRLFKRGARFRFMPEAMSVHLSHPSSCAEDTKPLRSVKNFRRLLEKHPELHTVARRWVVETFSKICAWIDSSNSLSNSENNQDRDWVQHLLQGSSSLLANSQVQKRLKILTFRWHCPHQYELYKLPHDFTLVTFPDNDFTNGWGYEQRPLRPNVTFKPLHNIDIRDYDLAILHFDENSLFPENSNGVLGRTWGRSFRWLRENALIPSIAICHGTPQFQGQYGLACPDQTKGQTLEYERKALVDYLYQIPVVCNSYQAKAEWGFSNATVIWHGFDPVEFGPRSIGQGVLTLGKMMKERPIYRGYTLFQDVQQRLEGKIQFSHLSVKRPAYDYSTSGNDFAYAKFRLYNQALRQYSVYFNPTQRSPMPRSRGEAMLSGLVSVSAMNHDVSYFIKNGVDGFYSNDAGELAEYLIYLNTHPRVCEEMGQKSRQLASDIFNIDRYHRDWNRELKKLV
jgi:glycosyltransferase involved in cell wall biosynthesis